MLIFLGKGLETTVQPVSTGVTKWVLIVINIKAVFVHVTPCSWPHREQAILEHRQQVPLKCWYLSAKLHHHTPKDGTYLIHAAEFFLRS